MLLPGIYKNHKMPSGCWGKTKPVTAIHQRLNRFRWTAHVRPKGATPKPALTLFLQLIFKIFSAVFSGHGLQHPAIGWELLPARWSSRMTLIWHGTWMSRVISSLFPGTGAAGHYQETWMLGANRWHYMRAPGAKSRNVILKELFKSSKQFHC